jgi:signal transduction histidine kinase
MDAHETTVYHAIIMSAVIIGCIIGYAVFSLYRQQRKNVRNQRLNFADEIRLLENERGRVSRDLHDGAGLLLSITKTHLNEVTALSAGDRFHIQKANEAVDQLVRQLGHIAVNLSPSSLVRKGLHYTLEHFFEETRQTFATEIIFVYEVKRAIPAEAAIHLYRIVQELTHNTMKHAGAGTLRVHFRENRGRLYLLCKDDGVGFDPAAAAEKGGGLGLGSLKSRTELLNGKLKCTSKPGYGTEYFFAFNLDGGTQNG